MGENNKTVDVEAFMAETGLDEETAKELYTGFIEEINEEREKLFSKFSTSDFSRLARTVHNIKGISGSYRLQNVFKQAQEIDASLKKNETGGVETAVERLENYIEEAVAEIRHHFEI